MHHQFFPIYCILFTIGILIHVRASLAQSNAQYLNCSEPFQCGNIQGIGYPFWGANRPEFCGHPSFFLNCTSDAPLITIQTRPYRILSIDNTTYNLRVVREEFWNNDCPQYLYNATLDTTHFSYAADAVELILYYGCSTLMPGITILNQFSCLENGTIGTFGIYGSSSLTTSAFNITTVSCNTSVRVWVNSTEGQALDSSTSSGNLTQVLASGFGLNWQANNSNCEQCIATGGRCGSNFSNPVFFACYCSDQAYAISCGTNQTGSGT